MNPYWWSVTVIAYNILVSSFSSLVEMKTLQKRKKKTNAFLFWKRKTLQSLLWDYSKFCWIIRLLFIYLLSWWDISKSPEFCKSPEFQASFNKYSEAWMIYWNLSKRFVWFGTLQASSIKVLGTSTPNQKIQRQIEIKSDY